MSILPSNNILHLVEQSGWNVCIYDIEEISPRFRRLRFVGEAIQQMNVQLGDSIQLMVDDRCVQNCVPIAVDKNNMSMDIIFSLHEKKPGSRWATQAQFGDLATFSCFEKRVTSDNHSKETARIPRPICTVP